MAITVDFYLNSEQSIKGCGLFICHLAEKIYNNGHWLYILTPSNDDTFYIDDLLWTFRDISFLPHTIYEDSLSVPAPIQVGHTKFLTAYNDVLLNLTCEIPDFYAEFTRIFEIVPNEPKLKNAARKKYKWYKNMGHTITIHNF